MEVEKMAKTGRKPHRTSDEAINNRVRQVLEILFHGNQQRAADALRVSQASISKISRGERSAGPKIRDALARNPKVSESWLLTGEGEPLIPPTDGTLPVANFCLPGAPPRHSSLLTGERYPVSTVLERETRYWLRMSDAFSKKLREDFSMLPGDLLLVETAADHIGRIDVVTFHLCVVSVPHGDDSPYFILARLTVEDRELKAAVYCDTLPQSMDFTTTVNLRYFPLPVEKRGSLDYPRPRRRRAIGKLRSHDKADEASEADGPPEKETMPPKSLNVKPDPEYTIDEIVGVVLSLQRDLRLPAPTQPVDAE